MMVLMMVSLVVTLKVIKMVQMNLRVMGELKFLSWVG